MARGKSKTPSEKLEILELAQKIGAKEAAKQHNISPTTLWLWRKEIDKKTNGNAESLIEEDTAEDELLALIATTRQTLRDNKNFAYRMRAIRAHVDEIIKLIDGPSA